jgi:hypothetical protein
MRVIAISTLFFLLFAVSSYAQKIPQERLNKIINDYTKDGFTLESTFAPDFAQPHPNASSRYIPCYPGKNVIIAAVMAFKPGSLQFNVQLNGKEVPKTHELENLSTKGESVYYDYRALKFGPKYVSSHKNCINIVLFDKAAPDKPVYTLVFTKPNK